MNPYRNLPSHTINEMLQTAAWELVRGSMDPQYAETLIRNLIDAGAEFVNEANL